MGGDVILSPKIYKSNKQLVIPSNTTIHGNNATIIFTNNQTMTGGYDYGYVVNEYSSYLYNEIRSKNIKIENITFKKENICEIEKAFLLLTNVENVVLNNVNIECLNVGDKINSLDILLNCRNIRVNNCKFTHAQSNVVGGVWVRNRMTYEKYEPTKDIVFTNCLFKRRGGIDEVLAIFTSNSYNGVHSTV